MVKGSLRLSTDFPNQNLVHRQEGRFPEQSCGTLGMASVHQSSLPLMQLEIFDN